MLRQMKTRMKLITFLPLVALAGLSACATIEGAGQDLQVAGATVSQEARKAEAGL